MAASRSDLLFKVETGEEVLETCAAFTQKYREEARYLERTAPWVERVGLQYIRDALQHAPTREALAKRFLYSQRFSQIDPWKARAEGAESHEFQKIEISAA